MSDGVPQSDDPHFAGLRKDYTGEFARRGVAEADLPAEPVAAFRRWLDEAAAAGLPEPNAMVVATADGEGVVTARTVLLKAVDEAGFVFFTDPRSTKGRAVAANPRASLVFPWLPLERQVVVVGRVEPVAADEAAAYFATRPRGAQVSSWASAQSGVVPDRAAIEAAHADAEARFAGAAEVPMPVEAWAGYRVVPDSVELWQGRPNRLHDRLRYVRDVGAASGWRLERLSP